MKDVFFAVIALLFCVGASITMITFTLPTSLNAEEIRYGAKFREGDLVVTKVGGLTGQILRDTRRRIDGNRVYEVRLSSPISGNVDERGNITFKTFTIYYNVREFELKHLK